MPFLSIFYSFSPHQTLVSLSKDPEESGEKPKAHPPEILFWDLPIPIDILSNWDRNAL